MKKVIVSFIIVCAVLAAGYYYFNKDNRSEVSLRLNWLTTCSFAGEVVGAEKFADANSIKLTLDKGGEGLDPIKLVESGVNTFGVAGADLVLSANDKGADFVIVGVVNYDSPGVWVSKVEKNIRTIADIKPDTRIGEVPGGNMIYLYEVFLKKTGLKRNVNFKPVPIPFDLKNFIAGDECDLRPIFNYEVLPELDLLNIKCNIIEPKNLGIAFKGLCYFCKRETFVNNPEVVKNFVYTMIQGWEYALANNKEAIETLKKFDSSINERKEILGLQVGKSYFQGYDNKILYSDIDSWHTMIADMRDLGFLKNDVDISKILYLDYVEQYYSK
jgi:ABC-type nitrate/sulfonate/bicarbonate transport system substrate-binding protein